MNYNISTLILLFFPIIILGQPNLFEKYSKVSLEKDIERLSLTIKEGEGKNIAYKELRILKANLREKKVMLSLAKEINRIKTIDEEEILKKSEIFINEVISLKNQLLRREGTDLDNSANREIMNYLLAGKVIRINARFKGKKIIEMPSDGIQNRDRGLMKGQFFTYISGENIYNLSHSTSLIIDERRFLNKAKIGREAFIEGEVSSIGYLDEKEAFIIVNWTMK